MALVPYCTDKTPKDAEKSIFRKMFVRIQQDTMFLANKQHVQQIS